MALGGGIDTDPNVNKLRGLDQSGKFLRPKPDAVPPPPPEGNEPFSRRAFLRVGHNTTELEDGRIRSESITARFSQLPLPGGRVAEFDRLVVILGADKQVTELWYEPMDPAEVIEAFNQARSVLSKISPQDTTGKRAIGRPSGTNF